MLRMEYVRTSVTRMNIVEDDNKDGGWHLVIAPRRALQNQQDQQDDLSTSTITNLPRAHFLHPDSLNSAFSPYSPDLRFEHGTLHNRCTGDTSTSLSSNPLAQPGFYSPKILRSNDCKLPSSTEHSLTGKAPSSCHSLPLPRSQTALLKQSDFSRKPQSTQTSHSDKPPVIKASMSQSSLELDLMNQQWNEVRFQPVQNQRSPNLRRPEISKKEEFILKHQTQTQVEQVPTQTNIKKNFSCVVPSQGLSDQAYVRGNLQSSGYCKLSLYNEPQHSQSHSGVTQNISRDNKDSGDHGNGSLRNNSVSPTDMKSRNVFGLPRVMAILRAACCPHPVHESTIVEDLKKLIVMDETARKPSPDSHIQPKTKPTGEHPRGSAPTNPFIFTSSDLGRPPLHGPEPPTVFGYQPMTELVESVVWNDDIQRGYGVTTPDTTHELDWNGLMDSADDYEMQGIANLQPVESQETSPQLFTPVNNGPILHHAVSEDPDDYVFINSPDQISHLEVMLRRLSTDLVKEKQNKVALVEEVMRLRSNNRHLKEESLSANVQLRHICQMFNIYPEGNE